MCAKHCNVIFCKDTRTRNRGFHYIFLFRVSSGPILNLLNGLHGTDSLKSQLSLSQKLLVLHNNNNNNIY